MAQTNQPGAGIAPPSDDAPAEPGTEVLLQSSNEVADPVRDSDPSTSLLSVSLDTMTASPVQLTIGGAVIVAAALAFLPVRSIIVSYFAAKRADPGAASRAGWSLYWLMLMLTVVVTAGYLFNLLTLPLFYISAGIVVAIFLMILVVSLVAAQRSVR